MKEPASILDFIKEVYKFWLIERPATLAAALAYYSLFSFAPAIFIGFSIAGLFLSQQQMVERFQVNVQELLGEEVAQFIQEAVSSISQSRAAGSPIVSFIGFLALIMAASMLFYQLQYALNMVWDVPPPKKGATLALIKNRLLAFAMVLGIGLVLIVATMINVVTSVINSILNLPGDMLVVNWIAAIALATVSFALIYKVLPEADIHWRDVWVGAGVTALLMAAGIWLLGIYIRSARISSALEAAGVVAVVLISFYILAQIFLFGAIFTRVYCSMYGSKIIPRYQIKTPDKENGSGEN